MLRVVLLLLVALVVAGCGGDDDTAAPETAPADGVAELENVLALRSDFEADKGKTRLLILFSPT